MREIIAMYHSPLTIVSAVIGRPFVNFLAYTIWEIDKLLMICKLAIRRCKITRKEILVVAVVQNISCEY